MCLILLDDPPRADQPSAVLELGARGRVRQRGTRRTLGRNWQKRAGLARALALDPEVLLRDNPLGGADALHAGWWLNFLGQLSAGHEVMPGKRATTLAVTADDVNPWRARARQF